jgi:hypothetical protein
VKAAWGWCTKPLIPTSIAPLEIFCSKVLRRGFVPIRSAWPLLSSACMRDLWCIFLPQCSLSSSGKASRRPIDVVAAEIPPSLLCSHHCSPVLHLRPGSDWDTIFRVGRFPPTNSLTDTRRTRERLVAAKSYSAGRAVLDEALPGAFDQHVADTETFFGQEVPALQQWSFTREDARRIVQPVLAVIGAKSQELDRIWVERQELLISWLPNVEPFVLPEARHLLQVENPPWHGRGAGSFLRPSPPVGITLLVVATQNRYSELSRQSQPQHAGQLNWGGRRAARSPLRRSRIV